jgi:uncharacterized hydrophobic protein (TIGR00271 family)
MNQDDAMAPADRDRTLQVEPDDVARMIDNLFITGRVTGRKASRFWVLLSLATIIATAGLVSDSTATVIGAMIVAPLMTPILGTALAVVLSDRPALIRSVSFVLGGAAVVIALAFAFGFLVTPEALINNSQIQSRISPRLIDLVAALATGAVGAFALVRSDVSDALPGVAIAISLVPPLGVVGLLLQDARFHDASEAGLLFATNVAAIVATGTVVMLLYRVRGAATDAGMPVGALTGRTLLVIGSLVVLVAIPLTTGSLRVLGDQRLEATATPAVEQWAHQAGAEVVELHAAEGILTLEVVGPLPEADAAQLRRLLDEKGLEDHDLILQTTIGAHKLCPAGSQTCRDTAAEN